MFKLLFLFVFLCVFDASAQQCRSLLQPNYSSYDFSVIRRPDRDISDNQKSRNFLTQLDREGAIVANSNSPYSREQCYGTCYAYASIAVLENALIKKGLLETSDLVLAPGVLTQVAQSRVQSGDKSESFQDLLDTGTLDVFHSLYKNPIYYLPKEEIKKLGDLKESSDLVLDLESAFLTTHYGYLSRSTAFSELPFAHPEMTEIIVGGFMEYINEYAQGQSETPLIFTTVGPISINYEVQVLKHVVVDEQPHHFILRNTVNTDEYPTVLEAENLFFNVTQDDNSARLVQGDFFDDEAIRAIIKELQEDNFVFVGLKSGIFGGEHAVTLTNIVVNPKSRTIMGFVFLDSNHRTQGTLGYRFISVRELKENTTFFAFITDIYVD